MTKILNDEDVVLHYVQQPPSMFRIFDYLNFEIVSKFEFRASDFRHFWTHPPC